MVLSLDTSSLRGSFSETSGLLSNDTVTNTSVISSITLTTSSPENALCLVAKTLTSHGRGSDDDDTSASSEDDDENEEEGTSDVSVKDHAQPVVKRVIDCSVSS